MKPSPRRSAIILTLAIAPPLAGRPAEFLGGVGTFEVRSGASPTTVRVGESLDYWITVTGPAAPGMTVPPDLSRLARLPIGLRVTSGPPEVVANPPSRTFRYRLRPTRPGSAVLPPVRIAAFDPAISRYVTKAAPGLSIRVADVPRFDPSTLRYAEPSPSPPTSPWPARFGWSAAVAVVAIAVGALGSLTRRNRGREARRLAGRIGREIIASLGAPEVARRAVEGLAAYLELTIGRPPGALTPDEAASGIKRATGRDDLSRQARHLVAQCDQARFAREHPPAVPLADEANTLFDELRKVKTGGKSEEPREAVEIADR